MENKKKNDEKPNKSLYGNGDIFHLVDALKNTTKLLNKYRIKQ